MIYDDTIWKKNLEISTAAGLIVGMRFVLCISSVIFYSTIYEHSPM